jgi:hypothetical protein
MLAHGLGPVTFRFRSWTWWYNAQGSSTEVLEGRFVSGQVVRAVMWSGTSVCNGAFDDWSQRARFEIDGLLFLDPRPHGSIVGLGVDLGSRHDVRNLLAFGGASTCASPRRTERGRIRSWARCLRASPS